MSLGLLIVIVVAGITMVVAAVQLTTASKLKTTPDAGEFLVEFANAFPEEAVRAVIMSANGKAAFFRLADERTGVVETFGANYVNRIVDPASIRVSPGDEPTSLKIDFLETSYKGGKFEFNSPEDANELLVWLMGAFAKAGRDAGDETVEGKAT